MTKTVNYKLNKPEPTDPVHLADLNENADIIDAALAGLSATLAGQTKMYCGSYRGTGTYGNNNKTTLTFDFVPQLIFLFNTDGEFTVLCRNVGTAYTADDGYGRSINLTWSENGVSWYYSRDAVGQYNAQDYPYHYVALYY